VQDGEVLKVGSIEIKFLHTPGHTPGSQCLHIRKRADDAAGILLSGDTLFIKRYSPASCQMRVLLSATPVGWPAYKLLPDL
jgi:glyoxylase-like metal-dependent hydrolase (beta-lactamase superfamily II)